MTDHLDIKTLARRESEQIEWKENVADEDDVVKTLSAFANDWANLGGGYVICGAREELDEHGFPRIGSVGLTAAKIREIENKILAGCRSQVDPPIAPRVEELPADESDRRLLVFVMPATRHVHLFRGRKQAGRYYVRISRETIEARNGILRELLVRKGAVDEWDRRPCATATVNDLDLIVLRDSLQRMGIFQPERGLDEYLSETKALSAFVPPILVREPLTGTLRPRNFAMLLFGRNLQLHVPGAFALFSIYPGTDRSEPHAERHEIAETLVEQARRLLELLDVQSYVAFDKTNQSTPNAVKYPREALREAMINALAHRDYEMVDPTRVTVFADRIEIVSPGSVPRGVSVEEMREGRAPAKWRNQCLAWFLNRLQFAQAEGQGIPTILRSMKAEGCPPPRFEASEARVVCLLPAHPRHRLAKEHRRIEEAISLGDFERARNALSLLLAEDPMNARTIQLFAEVQSALKSPGPVTDFLSWHEVQLDGLPTPVLTQLGEALQSGEQPAVADLKKALEVYREAFKRQGDLREYFQKMKGLAGEKDYASLRLFLDSSAEHPDLKEDPDLAWIRGATLMDSAVRCGETAANPNLPKATRARASKERRRFLRLAEEYVLRAIALSKDPESRERFRQGLVLIEGLKHATPPEIG